MVLSPRQASRHSNAQPSPVDVMPRRERHNCHESCRDELFSDGQRRNGLETAPLRGVSDGVMRFIPSVMFSVETESRDFFTIFKRAVNLLAAMAFRPVPRIYYGQTGETCLFRTGS